METIYIRFFKDLPFMVDCSIEPFEEKDFYTVITKEINRSDFGLDITCVTDGNKYLNTLNDVEPEVLPGQYAIAEDLSYTKRFRSISKYIFDNKGFVNGLKKEESYVDEHSEYFLKCLTSPEFGYRGQFPISIAQKVIRKKTKQDLFKGVNKIEDFYDSLNPMVHPDIHGFKGISKEKFEYIMKALCSFESSLYGEKDKDSGEYIKVDDSLMKYDISILNDALEGSSDIKNKVSVYLGHEDLYNFYSTTLDEKVKSIYISNFKRFGLKLFKEKPSILSLVMMLKKPSSVRVIIDYCKKMKPSYTDQLGFITVHERTITSATDIIFKDILAHMNRVDLFKNFVREAILPNVGKEWKFEKACNIFEPLDDTALDELCSYYSIDSSIPRSRKCMELYLVIKRLRVDTNVCNNTETSISGDPVSEIDPRLLFTFEENGKTYCENIEELHEYISHGADKNPFTNVPFTEDTKGKIITEFSKLKNIKRVGNPLSVLEEKPLSQLWADLIVNMYYAPGYEKYINADLKRINMLRKYLSIESIKDKSENNDRELIEKLISKNDEYKEYIITNILSDDTSEIESYLYGSPVSSATSTGSDVSLYDDMQAGTPESGVSYGRDLQENDDWEQEEIQSRRVSIESPQDPSSPDSIDSPEETSPSEYFPSSPDSTDSI